MHQSRRHLHLKRVNYELKYYGHDEQLEQRVADIVQSCGMESDVVAMSLKSEGVQKMKAIRPDWSTMPRPRRP